MTIRSFLLLLLAFAASLSVHAGDVLPGIDVLERDGFRQLAGARVGLITNHTGLSRDGRSTIQLLHEAANVELVRLFSPEHSISGDLDTENIGDAVDAETGIPIVSLYGEVRRPTAAMLADIDTLVFDIQDIGTRFYTYISTLGNAMIAAAEHDIRFVVLDRPNPINGIDVAGPVLDDGLQSFVGFHPIPVRHGMTVGELARMFNDELALDLDLHVVRIGAWHRSDFLDDTGLPWVNPSPNMRSQTEALLYPGIGLLETTNVSVGRGTATPFELIGAPWLDGESLAGALNEMQLPGIAFTATRFTPDASTFAGELCEGVRFTITDRSVFEPLTTGLSIARQLLLDYPDDWQTDRYLRLLGNEAALRALLDGKSVSEIKASYQKGLDEFLARRTRYLLYD
ncbi:MAG: DUF1343 domain-containing protein [Gammaproteobacteria bacterium]|nr:DUF1343 domain-containing protein [Gammaproteobacteria bacterium]